MLPKLDFLLVQRSRPIPADITRRTHSSARAERRPSIFQDVTDKSDAQAGYWDRAVRVAHVEGPALALEATHMALTRGQFNGRQLYYVVRDWRHRVVYACHL